MTKKQKTEARTEARVHDTLDELECLRESGVNIYPFPRTSSPRMPSMARDYLEVRTKSAHLKLSYGIVHEE